jgi:hypothetical protein
MDELGKRHFERAVSASDRTTLLAVCAHVDGRARSHNFLQLN